MEIALEYIGSPKFPVEHCAVYHVEDITRNPNAGVYLGRDPDGCAPICKPFANLTMISGKHCFLFVSQQEVYIRDDSMNGTWLNNQRIERGHRVKISNSDIIWLVPGVDNYVGFKVTFRMSHSPPNKLEDSMATLSLKTDGNNAFNNHTAATATISTAATATISTAATATRINSGESGSSNSQPERELDDLANLSVHDIRILSVVGQGNYGQVCYGIWEDKFEVALKSLKAEKNKLGDEFVKEITILTSVNHPNTTHFYGVYKDSKNVYMVTEWAQGGDLRAKLIDENKRLVAGAARHYSVNDLLDMCRDVCRGMKYLSTRNPAIVHRDLALRNLLVGYQFVNGYRQRIIKVSDFGLSRLTNFNFYQTMGSCEIAYHWASPESLRSGRYSVYSDVWSFGVTCWEIFSLGRMPYSEFPNFPEAWKNIEQGYRLQKPELCTEQIYFLLKLCWTENPIERPTFEYLYHELGKCYLHSSPSDQNQHALPNHKVQYK